MAMVVRSLPSLARFWSVPTNTTTRSAEEIAARVSALQLAGVVAVVDVPQASKVTVAPGFAALTAVVMPCTGLTCSDGSPE